MSADHVLASRLMQLEHQGYTVVPDAIPADLLPKLRRRFDELVAQHATLPTAVHYPQTGAIDLNRLLEMEAVFEPLIDLPSVFPFVEMLHEGDMRLLGQPIGNFMPAGSPARVGWHQDGGPYTRLTFLLSDLAEDGGATAVVPGTHRLGENPPPWVNDETGQPRIIPGMVKVGGKAGACMINNTYIWHASTPNRSDEPRRIVWVVYKREAQAMPPPHQYNLLFTRQYLARQTDPRRRRLIERAVVPEEAATGERSATLLHSPSPDSGAVTPAD